MILSKHRGHRRFDLKKRDIDPAVRSMPIFLHKLRLHFMKSIRFADLFRANSSLLLFVLDLFQAQSSLLYFTKGLILARPYSHMSFKTLSGPYLSFYRIFLTPLWPFLPYSSPHIPFKCSFRPLTIFIFRNAR